MIQITSVHMSAGAGHEHIAQVKWINPSTSATGVSDRGDMVSWIEAQPQGSAVVSDGRNTVAVGVVNASPKYIRTYADGKWTDNLLALPRY